MTTMTFAINDSSTSSNSAVVQISITVNGDGTVTFTVTQQAGYVGDLRGLFFDLGDESLLSGTLSVLGSDVTDRQFGNDSVTNLGDGANMSGLVGDYGGYDVGVEFGSSGLRGTDDIRVTTFTLGSSLRPLTLADFSNVSFGARVTSVGLDSNLDGTFETSRLLSSKTGEVTFVAISPTNDSVAAVEDGVTTGNLLTNDHGGVGDVLTVMSWSGGALGDAIPIAGLAGATITVNSDGTYSIDGNPADSLAAGESLTQTFTYTVLQTNPEGTTTQTASLTVTITGTNDAPVIAGEVFSEGVNELGSNVDVGAMTTSGSIEFDDADLTDGHTVGFTPVGATLGTLSAVSITDPATGAGAGTVGWSYSVNASAVAYLAAGETLVEEFNVTVSDDDGTALSDAATVRVTITGTNDAPVIAGEVFSEGVNELGSNVDVGAITASGSIEFDDADLTDAHTVDFTAVGATLGTLSALSVADPATGAGAGTVGWSYSVNASAVAYLAAGETLVEEFTVTVSDDDGTALSDTATVRVTITGTNDVPMIEVGDLAFDVSETLAETNAALSTTGRVVFSDVDIGDTPEAALYDSSVSPTGITLSDAQIDAIKAGFSITNAATGAWSYNLASPDYLAAGDSVTATFTVRVTDDEGAFVDQAVTLTINGTNDGPVLTGDLTGEILEGGSYQLTGADLGYADPDDGASEVSFTVSGLTNGKMQVNGADATTFTGAQLAAGEVAFVHDGGETTTASFSVSVEDGNEDDSAPVPQVFNLVVTPVNDAPVISLMSGDWASAALTETDSPLTASDTLTVRDVDLGDSVTTTVTAVSVGGTYSGIGALSNSALLAMMSIAPPATAAADGTDLNNITWSFNSGTEAFNYLAAGETLQLTYTLTSSDGSASDTQDVVVTITGTADTAVVSTSQLTLDVSDSVNGNSLPSGTLGQLSVTGGSGSYAYSLANFTATNLAGGSVNDFAGDLAISSTGVVTANALDGGRIYSLVVNAQQGATTLTETFRVITGTNAVDTLNGSATGDDVIFADGDGDIILAGSGDDTVFGQQGGDKIHGGDGNDVLAGGGGDDLFVFDTTPNAVTNVDHIKDFGTGGGFGTDTIWLSKSNFSDLATNGTSAGVTLNSADYYEVSSGGASVSMGSARILYEQATGSLFYDADGGDATGRVLFAVLDNKPLLGSMDFDDFKVGV